MIHKPGFALQTEGPSARDLMVKYSTGKKTTKNKKKMEKAMKVLKVPLAGWLILRHLGSDNLNSFFKILCAHVLSAQKHKKKKKAEVFNFSAIHLIHDPQGRLTRPLCYTTQTIHTHLYY